LRPCDRVVPSLLDEGELVCEIAPPSFGRIESEEELSLVSPRVASLLEESELALFRREIIPRQLFFALERLDACSESLDRLGRGLERSILVAEKLGGGGRRGPMGVLSGRFSRATRSVDEDGS